MGNQFIPMTNYNDILTNFRNQFCQVNKDALILAKGKAELSDNDLEEQQKIAEFFSVFDEAISSAKKELEKWNMNYKNKRYLGVKKKIIY